jgi:hypothetical protein
MTGIIYKFPYSVARRAYSRMGRVSKNGTPEERAAKAAAVLPDPASLANVVQISRRRVDEKPTLAATPEEFAALLAQLPECELPAIGDMMRRLLDKNAT